MILVNEHSVIEIHLTFGLVSAVPENLVVVVIQVTVHDS